jgi:large subunit ribosomal protein L20
MPRTKDTARVRHKKILKLAKGQRGRRKNCITLATEAVHRALAYSFRDRRRKKRDFRSLWITRINAACHENGTTYSRLINGLKNKNIKIDRKMLADLAVKNNVAFKNIVAQVA